MKVITKVDFKLAKEIKEKKKEKFGFQYVGI